MERGKPKVVFLSQQASHTRRFWLLRNEQQEFMLKDAELIHTKLIVHSLRNSPRP